MNFIENIAIERAGRDQPDYMAWLDALSEGLGLREVAGIAESQFEGLARNCSSPNQFLLLMEAFAEWRKEHPDAPSGFNLLASAVDESPYGLGSWVESIEYFYDWLGQNQRHANFQCIIGFLHCCVEAAGSGPERLPLKELLVDMLDTYGFQG